jgi:glycosyltransferase involved in cell wall biosynthesis
MVGLDDPGWETEPFYRALGVEAVRLPCPRDVDPALLARLARTLRTLRPDVVHTHLVHADVYGGLAAPPGAALVSTKHNDDPFRTGPFRLVERALARRARRLIAITDALRRFTVERVGVPAAKVEVVHYGLDELPGAWGENPPDPVGDGGPVLLCVARLEPQKGVDVAIRALPRIAEGTLVVLGEGSGRASLEELARGLGVAERVHLPGRVPDVAAWLRRASLLVHPVRWEGFGLAVLEAMLAGLPVVATRVSSLPELVADGETGVLVPPDDPVALAAAVERALAEPALGERGRARAHAEFSVARMAERTLAVYARARTW